MYKLFNFLLYMDTNSIACGHQIYWSGIFFSLPSFHLLHLLVIWRQRVIKMHHCCVMLKTSHWTPQPTGLPVMFHCFNFLVLSKSDVATCTIFWYYFLKRRMMFLGHMKKIMAQKFCLKYSFWKHFYACYLPIYIMRNAIISTEITNYRT